MPTVVRIEPGNKRTWIGQITGTFNPEMQVTGPFNQEIATAQIMTAHVGGKINGAGFVQAGSLTFVVVSFKKPKQQCDAKDDLKRMCEGLEFQNLRALDFFDAALFGWAVEDSTKPPPGTPLDNVTATWYPADFQLECLKDTFHARKLAYMLHVAPGLQKTVEGLPEFFKVFCELFRDIYKGGKAEYNRKDAGFTVFALFSGLKLKFDSLEAPLKAQLESHFKDAEINRCRCGKKIAVGATKCSKCPELCNCCGESLEACNKRGIRRTRGMQLGREMLGIIHGIGAQCVDTNRNGVLYNLRPATFSDPSEPSAKRQRR